MECQQCKKQIPFPFNEEVLEIPDAGYFCNQTCYNNYSERERERETKMEASVISVVNQLDLFLFPVEKEKFIVINVKKKPSKRERLPDCLLMTLEGKPHQLITFDYE